jgi:integrase
VKKLRFGVKDIPNLPPGKHALGDQSIILEISTRGSRSWTMRYWISGRERWAGLGSWPEVTIGKAQALAAEMRDEIRRGIDPVDARKERRRQDERTGKTVSEVAAEFRRTHEPGWRPNYVKAVRSLHAAIEADLGKRPVASMDVATIKAFLEPRMAGTPERARKMRACVKALIDFAAAHGWVDERLRNPAAHDVMRHVLPKPSKPKSHFRAADWKDAPLLYQAMAARRGASVEAMRLVLLSGCRSSEIAKARWDEVDWDEQTLTIPPARSKTKVQHIVPLVPAAMAALRRQEEVRRGPFIFPSNDARKPISDMAMLVLLGRIGWHGRTTVHGFRSMLRSWCADSGVDAELAESLLAHKPDPIVSAYQRSQMVERKRAVLLRWEAHVVSGMPLEVGAKGAAVAA